MPQVLDAAWRITRYTTTLPTSNQHKKKKNNYATNLKQNEAQSARAESTNTGVNQRSKILTQVQKQRPESPAVTLDWHACKYKVHKLNLTSDNYEPTLNWSTTADHANHEVTRTITTWRGSQRKKRCIT